MQRQGWNDMTFPFLSTRRDFLAGSAAAAFAALGPRVATARDNKQLIFALSSYPANVRPFENFGTSAATVKLQSYRGLLSYGPNGQPRPEIASEYKAEDAKTYTVKLRPGVTFHNGEPLTSDDVKFTFETIAGTSAAYLANDLKVIDRIVIQDPLTLTFHLNTPSATFPLLLASFDSPIVSSKAYKASPQQPVGCGPYIVTGSERGAWIELKAFERYYKSGYPKIASLRFVALPDESARMAALLSGDVDLTEYVPASRMQDIRKNSQFFLDAVEGPSTYLLFNVARGPFANPLVRQAVGYAVNRADIVKGAFGGEAAPLSGLPIPASSPFANTDASVKWTYDPQKARALLAQAGHPNGFTTKLVTYNASVHQDPATVAQQQLAAVGINAELLVVDWPTRIQIGNQGQYEIGIMANSADSNDPDALKLMLQGTLGASFYRSAGYNNQQINDLLQKGRAEISTEGRRQAYQDIEKASFADPAIVPLCWRNQAYAGRKGVQGFSNLPGFLTFYSGIMIENAAFV